MYGPEWNAACPGCSFQAEHIDGPAQHLPHHNVTIVAVSRAPLPKIQLRLPRLVHEGAARPAPHRLQLRHDHDRRSIHKRRASRFECFLEG
jgi:hypothetical protein